MPRKVTLEEFIERARKVHGNKYDYSKVNLINTHTPVIIICPIHGEFEQTPKAHMIGQGCSDCNKPKQLNTENFIKRARAIHGDKYDYSKTICNKRHSIITITCPIHGDFQQSAHNHLNGEGCLECSGKKKKTTKEFIENARKVHGNKYDYSKVDYKGNKKPIIIICPIHGEFEQTPSDHLNGYGCKKCANDSASKRCRKSINQFIKEACKVHGNKYDYSKVDYKTAHDTVTITCPIHGDFPQRPSDHLNGHGCPKCNQSHLEKDIEKLLQNNNIKYEYNKYYKELDNLQLDFYIPSLKIGIECQGRQHFQNIEYFGGEENLKSTQQRDALKRELCEKNGIKLLYYSDLGIDYPYEVIEDKNLILEELIIAKDKLL